jgi:23S rRNA (uracil1939-C5)-methyltransferase
MIATVEKLVQGGSGFCRLETGESLFVQGALPGESVEYEVDRRGNGYLQAHATRILSASPDRVFPPCPHFGTCGGCDLQYLDCGKQAAAKLSLVLENLGRIGSVDTDGLTVEPTASGPSWGYRGRVRFHVDLSSRTVGFLAKRTNVLVPIERCPILVDRLDAALHDKKPILEAARKLMFSGRSGKGPYIEVNAFCGDSALSFGDEPVECTVDGHRFLVSARVFFQGNRSLLGSMGSFVDRHCIGDSVMDLYSGVGTFASFLQREGRSVVAVERDGKCLSLARRNVPAASFFTDSVEKWAKKSRSAVDTVVVDPPRTGLEASVPALVAGWKPRRIIYVSCNSVTLARDLQRFSDHGYTARVLKVFDLYPQTFHQEMGVVLDCKEK